jgi:glycosyltransferase involved in cell wall biosynthesis
MLGNAVYRARLEPLPVGVARPLWSVMIPTYHCAKYLGETLTSVLSQDPGPDVMQIEVVDDHSTSDDPSAVVAELGRGRVGFYRQPRNVGHTENFRTCLERSRGMLIHLLHGDDCVVEGFYRTLRLPFESHPELGAAFCRHVYMDQHGQPRGMSDLEQPESGILLHWLDRIAVKQRIQTPSIVVRREVYEKLGMFDRRLSWVEDWEMWVRIAAHYAVWYEVLPLARYRMHANSNTGRYMRTGENLRDVRRAIRIIRSYVPVTVVEAISRRSRDHWALNTLLYRVPEFLEAGDLQTAMIQAWEALRCSQSRAVISPLPSLVWRMGKLLIRRAFQRLESGPGYPRTSR